MPPGWPTRAEQRVERVDGERVEQPVGVRERRAADDRDRRLLLGERAREPLDLLRGDAGDLLDPRRRVVRQAGRPAVDRGAGAPGVGRRSLPARITCARPSASTPSVPGFTGTHSSALAPVSDIRDSTCTNAPRTPGRPCRISP